LSSNVILRPLFLALVAVLGVGGLGLGLVACGGDRSGGPKGAPSTVVGNAPDKTLDARTARVTIDGEQVTASGVVDLATATARLQFRPGPMLIVAGGSTFVMTNQDHWRRSDGVNQLPASLQGANPLLAVDLLRGVVETDPYGGAEVRGASTIRYTVHIDPAQALAQAPPERVDALRQSLAGSGPGQIRAEVYIDAAGRIRRVQLPADLKAGPPVTRVDGEVRGATIDYDDFGVAVDVTAPPPSQVEGP
jgi:hypothetical protein